MVIMIKLPSGEFISRRFFWKHVGELEKARTVYYKRDEWTVKEDNGIFKLDRIIRKNYKNKWNKKTRD